MWNPGILCRPPAGVPRSGHSGTMARRRCLVSRRVTLMLAGCLLLGLGLVGMVSLSNEVINLREEISVLEDRREFLKAQQADLLARWIAARSPEVIAERARRELGLVVADDPDLALIRVSPESKTADGRWQHLIDGLGGGQVAWADEGQTTLNPEPRPHE